METDRRNCSWYGLPSPGVYYRVDDGGAVYLLLLRCITLSLYPTTLLYLRQRAIVALAMDVEPTQISSRLPVTHAPTHPCASMWGLATSTVLSIEY